jgi:hypothetical protein
MTNFLHNIDTNVLVALTAAGGAVLVKLVEKWASHKNNSFVEGERIRNELRLEINLLKEKIHEADDWKTKYWDMLQKHNVYVHKIHELEQTVELLQSGIEEWKTKYLDLVNGKNTDEHQIQILQNEIQELRILVNSNIQKS